MKKFDYTKEVLPLQGSGIYVCSEYTISELMKQLDDQVYKVTQDGDYYVEVVQERFNKVIVVDKDVMGGSDKKLGRILLKSYFANLRDISLKPEKILFYNEAVKVTEDEEFVPILKDIEESGVELLLCGTCIKFFEVDPKVGEVSNMFTIIATQMNAEQVLRP